MEQIVPGRGFLLVSRLDSTPGDAANMNLPPSISLEDTWESSIFGISTDETSDFIFGAMPAFTLSVLAFSTGAEITVGVECERSADYNRKDETAATNGVVLTVADPSRITPRFFLKPSATLVETRDSICRTERTQDPIQELSATETIVTKRSKQVIYGAGYLNTYRVAPNVDFTLGGRGTKPEFVETGQETDEKDSESISVDASGTYRVSHRFPSGLLFTTTDNLLDRSPDSRGYGWGMTAKYLLSPCHALSMQIGTFFFEEGSDATGQRAEEWSHDGKLSRSGLPFVFPGKLFDSAPTEKRETMGTVGRFFSESF